MVIRIGFLKAVLQQRIKDAKRGGDGGGEELVHFKILLGDLKRCLHGFLHVALHVGKAREIKEERAALKVVHKRAIIKIDRADKAPFVVGKHALGVNKAGGVFVNAHARLQQKGIV